MTDLLAGPYGPNDVFVATAGYATKALQRNWMARGMFRTPIPEPRPAKPREYPWLAVVEAAMLAQAGRRGISLNTVASAMSFRLFEAASRAGCQTSEIRQLSEHLPEFHARWDGPRYCWLIRYADNDPRPDGAIPNLESMIAVKVFTEQGEIPSDIFLSPSSLIIGVSANVLSVEQMLLTPGRDEADLTIPRQPPG